MTRNRHIIVAAEPSNCTADSKHLPALLDAVVATAGEFGRPRSAEGGKSTDPKSTGGLQWPQLTAQNRFR
jgi:hypothetical protein